MKEGSFSVEAAMLMPIVIFIIFSVMFFGFYLRDIILVESSARAFLIDIKKEELAKEAVDAEEESRRKLVSECMWWGNVITFSVTDDNESVLYMLGGNMFFFDMYSYNSVSIGSAFDGDDKIRLFGSIVEEAKELVLPGGSVDGS